MKKIITLLLLSLIFPSFAHAEYEKGLVAFDKKDYKTAAEEWSQNKNPVSMNSKYKLGLLYFSGKGVRKDDAKAYSLLLEAAETGHSKSQYVLWQIGKGKAKTEDDMHQAFAWLEKSALQGFAKAQYSLGLANGVGKLIPKDNAKALFWLDKAVKNGVGEAENDLRIIQKRLDSQ